MKVVWTNRALRDVAAHVDYLADVNPLAAHDLAVKLVATGDSLSALPHRGRPGRVPGTRELVAASPYIVVYEIMDNAVKILRVWHGKLLV